MTDNLQTLREDLDYVKALAREGRHAPLTGGSILVLAGGIWGTTSLVMYGMLKGYIPATQTLANGIWIGASALFMAGLVLLVRRGRGAPGAGALNNRAQAAGWKGAGIGVFAMIASQAAASWRLHDANFVWLIAPVILVLYGVAWTVAAAMTERKWLGWLGVASWAAAFGLGLMAGSSEMFLGYAAALFLLAGVPGLVLMRGQPSAVI